jgi:hypothetical protein
MKHTLKAPVYERLKSKCDELLSSLACNFNDLRRYTKASEWFEFEQAKNGRPTDAPFGVDEMEDVVEFLKEQGVSSSDIGKLVCAHPPVLSYSIEAGPYR